MGKLENRYYRLGEVAKILGLSKRTIIRYEKKGFFPQAHRNSINGWREYTFRDIKKMQEIMGRL
jgi:DNA-binding transcriptional MerR regulator